MNIQKYFKLPTPSKVWVSSFPSVNRNRISVSAIMKKIEKWLPFRKYRSYTKILNHWPPISLGLQFSQCQQKQNISVSHYEKNWKIAAISYHWKTWNMSFLLVQFSEFSIGSVFSITHSRCRFNIFAWLCLKHLCVDIYAWWPFCTSKKVSGLPHKSSMCSFTLLDVLNHWLKSLNVVQMSYLLSSIIYQEYSCKCQRFSCTI